MNWTDFDDVGEVRAHYLRLEHGSPEEFIESCKEESPDVKPYAALDLARLRSTKKVGHEVASSIIDQMVEELVDL